MKKIMLGIGLISIIAVGVITLKPKSCGASCAPVIEKVEPQAFQKKIVGNTVVIDIRTSEEYASGHIAGAENIDFYQTEKFVEYMNNLDKSQNYLVYCRSGNRSAQSMEVVKKVGGLNVTELSGGINAWQKAGLPIVK